MSLNFDLVGVDSEPAMKSWTTADVLLYALGVGAGQADPLAELEFTTENSIGVQTKVLPTFGNMITGGGRGRSLGDFDPAAFVHAEQAFTLHRPLPTAGTSRSVSRVAGIYDKGSAALVVTESTAVDAATGAAALYVVRDGVALGLSSGANGAAWGYNMAKGTVGWTWPALPWPHFFSDLSGLGGSAAVSGDTVVVTACQRLASSPGMCADPELVAFKL